MANLQLHFKRFDGEIALDYNHNLGLAGKREILLANLKRELRRIYGYRCPKFTPFNQGSYDLRTGVKPLEGDDYDIDIGLVFDISKNDYSPIEVKSWVHDALDSPPRTVEYKRPCVRVQYRRNETNLFHVDLAIYSNPARENWLEKKYHIAKGYLTSKDENVFWEPSHPHELKKVIKTKFRVIGDGEQFRRVIRYLKRWKDCNFNSDSNEKPTGIAITACAYSLFQPYKESNFSLMFGSNSRYDDLKATTNLVSNILNQFNFYNQIEINLPVEPYNNLFHRMTAKQMENFKSELEYLKDALISASLDANRKDACYTLQTVFGEDFPQF